MLQGYAVYDADAHAIMSPAMWRDLPDDYRRRRPRAVRIIDDHDLGRWNTGWLIEGRLEPHVFGPGSHAANTPGIIIEEMGTRGNVDKAHGALPVGCLDLSNPQERLATLDKLGIDVQFLMPSTLYANITEEPAYEAALYRTYNRYMAQQCRGCSDRLKWAALLPLRDASQAGEAIEEMQKLGAAAAVVYGTVGNRMLSHSSFAPVWEEFARSGLPLCVHMGSSYAALNELCENILDSNMISKALPANLAFVALVGHGMLDRYPNMKIGFLEFGAEWIFYMAGRLKHYAALNRRRMPSSKGLLQRDVDDYFKSGRIFVAAEADDAMLVQEMTLLGEDQILFSSDFPHDEGRGDAMKEIIERNDISQSQKKKILHHNTVRFFEDRR
jgi:predicted TIM-barrel fold metal-dependent hydrolase